MFFLLDLLPPSSESLCVFVVWTQFEQKWQKQPMYDTCVFDANVALIFLMSCVACLTSRSCAGFDATLVPGDGQGSETCAEVGACDRCNACFGLSLCRSHPTLRSCWCYVDAMFFRLSFSSFFFATFCGSHFHWRKAHARANRVIQLLRTWAQSADEEQEAFVCEVYTSHSLIYTSRKLLLYIKEWLECWVFAVPVCPRHDMVGQTKTAEIHLRIFRNMFSTSYRSWHLPGATYRGTETDKDLSTAVFAPGRKLWSLFRTMTSFLFWGAFAATTIKDILSHTFCILRFG